MSVYLLCVGVRQPVYLYFFSMFLSGFFLFHSKIKATNITNREICTEHFHETKKKSVSDCILIKSLDDRTAAILHNPLQCFSFYFLYKFLLFRVGDLRCGANKW